MTNGVAGVVLAAGVGTRLRPLTRLRPKALCPIDGVPLVDLAIERTRSAVDDVAVNAHHELAAMEAHLRDDGPASGAVHLSVEADRPLGTAGALGHVRGWLDGRAALVVNADAWCPGSLASFVESWDGGQVRILVAGGDTLTPTSRVAATLLPWSTIAPLAPEPSGLYEVVWAQAQAEGRLGVVRHDGPFIDCGTPAHYLAANLAASGGESVVGAGAMVAGAIDRCVVWPGAVVWPHESLTCTIRATEHMSVLVR
ncbi:MAG: sugar phosphate nucleotidyltransferase [Acidimicrobiales bacterium]